MLLHMAGALVLGWALGYERYFSGRAAGSQVYCLVCTTSSAVTLLAGYPSLWYWGTVPNASADPTHVVGAILQGIGFLGAGIIVKGGTNIRGLTTAASIWASSAIGILVGVGFYVVAIGLTALFLISMTVVPRLEHRLPARTAILTTLRYRENHRPQTEEVHRFLVERGLHIVTDSLSVSFENDRFELRCVVMASAMRLTDTLSRMSEELPQMPSVESFTVSHYSRG